MDIFSPAAEREEGRKKGDEKYRVHSRYTDTSGRAVMFHRSA